MLHRPQPAGLGGHIWVSFSPDLHHWGDHTIVLRTRPGPWWDSHKVGLGPQPIKTNAGWLVMYHGVKDTAAGKIYRLGLSFFDFKYPLKLKYRSPEWVFSPEEPYERIGDVDNVTFATGLIWDKKTDNLNMYYGAADTYVAVATAKMSDVLSYLKQYPVVNEREYLG